MSNKGIRSYSDKGEVALGLGGGMALGPHRLGVGGSSLGSRDGAGRPPAPALPDEGPLSPAPESAGSEDLGRNNGHVSFTLATESAGLGTWHERHLQDRGPWGRTEGRRGGSFHASLQLKL